MKASDPRVGWALSAVVLLLGVVVAVPAEGQVETVAGIAMVAGFAGVMAFGTLTHLRIRRSVPPDQRGPWWWSNWRDI
jgi:hypothetical protein